MLQYEINEITSYKLNRQIKRIDEEKTRSVENDTGAKKRNL